MNYRRLAKRVGTGVVGLAVASASALVLYYALPEFPKFDEATRIQSVQYATFDPHHQTRQHIDALVEQFHAEMLPQQSAVMKASSTYDVPPETIMASIFIEYARLASVRPSDVVASREGVRTGLKRVLFEIPGGEFVVDKVLGRAVGHGLVHKSTLAQALAHPLYQDRFGSGTSSTQDGISAGIDNVGKILFVHQRMWEQAGFPLYSHLFSTIQSPAERTGLHVTLYNIFDFGKKQSAPKADPQLGGSVIPSLNMRFGDLAAIYAANHYPTFAKMQQK